MSIPQKLLPAQKYASKLNLALNFMLHYDGKEYKPKVCFCCDILLLDTNYWTMSIVNLKKHSALFISDRKFAQIMQPKNI